MKLLTALLLAGATLPLQAIITTDAPANHVVSPGSLFDGVGLLTSSAGLCSGALLEDGIHFVTAAHCVTSAGTTTPLSAASINVRFDLPGGPQNYTGTALFIHPTYNAASTLSTFTGDLAILALNMIVDIAAQRYGIYRNTDEVGQTTYLVGYGRNATGNVGEGVANSGTKHVGQNQFDTATATGFLEFDFDNGQAAQNSTGSLGLGTDEANTARGDSGGPGFILSGGAYLIAGIHSYGRCPAFQNVDIDGTCDATPRTVNATFGELGGDTRLSDYQAFVDSILTPEPASFGLMALGLAAAAIFRRKLG